MKSVKISGSSLDGSSLGNEASDELPPLWRSTASGCLEAVIISHLHSSHFTVRCAIFVSILDVMV